MLLTDDHLLGKIYNLFGRPITQEQLALSMNIAFKINLSFKNISVEEYLSQRKVAHGEFMGTVIGGIYEGIKLGKFDGKSDYYEVTKREHKSIDEIMREFVRGKST